MTSDPVDPLAGRPAPASAVLTRRRALALLGGALALLAGCADDDEDTASATSATSATTAGTAAPGATPTAPSSTHAPTDATGTAAADTDAGCTVIPEETAGPFPGDGTNGPDALRTDGVVRSDIRPSFGTGHGTAAGVPLTITIALLDTTDGCQPLNGAGVYVWHCDQQGRYSMYSAGATEEDYLRGVQQTGADGTVTFTSIFPAAYPGRWPHIHFEVYESAEAATIGGRRWATSQIALPEDACNAVYATPGYEPSVANMRRTTLANDTVFGDDRGVHQLGTVSGGGAGYTVTLTVPVDTDATSPGGAGGPGGPGDGAPGGGPPGAGGGPPGGGSPPASGPPPSLALPGY